MLPLLSPIPAQTWSEISVGFKKINLKNSIIFQ